MNKNIPLATAFFDVAAEAGDSFSMRELAYLRKRHYILSDDLTVSPVYRQSRAPLAKQLIVAAIGGGNLDEESAEDFKSLMRGNTMRHRSHFVGKSLLRAMDVLSTKAAEIAGIILKA